LKEKREAIWRSDFGSKLTLNQQFWVDQEVKKWW